MEVELTFLGSAFLDVAEVEVEHGIALPLCLELLDGESFEKLSPSGEISVKGTRQQRLAEAARTRQKDELPWVTDVINIFRFVDIEKSALADFLKSLYSYRIVYHSA